MRPDDAFVQQLHEVLGRLYDYSYLQGHPLSERLETARSLAPRERARYLRKVIIDAIEELNPGDKVPFRSARARTYAILTLRYVEGMMVEEVARELAISGRQLYRHLRKAEQDLAALLWARNVSVEDESGTAGSASPREQFILREVERLEAQVEQIDLGPLLEGALAAVDHLSHEYGVHVQAAPVPEPAVVRTDRWLAKQVLVGVLSHAVQSTQRGTTLEVHTRTTGSRPSIQIRLRGRDGAPYAEELPMALQQLLRRLGARFAVDAHGPGMVAFTLVLDPGLDGCVLIIDDNEGLVDLFRRYLAGTGYRLVAATDAREGWRAIEEAVPDIIVLDVMMPQSDGWEVLQRLRTHESTRHVPVIVCSVFDDPRLAFSLGATGFLAKPVDRAHLLAALAQCRPRSPAGKDRVAPADS